MTPPTIRLQRIVSGYYLVKLLRRAKQPPQGSCALGFVEVTLICETVFEFSTRRGTPVLHTLAPSRLVGLSQLLEFPSGLLDLE